MSEALKKGALIPKLRFPEFQQDDLPWLLCTLSGATLWITAGLSAEQRPDRTNFPVTRIETIADGRINLDRVGFVSEVEGIESFRLRIGDILLSNINSTEHIGKSVRFDSSARLYHGMNLLRIVPNPGKMLSSFHWLQLSTERVRSTLRAQSNKAVNQASINQTALGKTILGQPSLAEQRKIAECLQSLDELIAAETDKLEALKRYKKGLLQQLFPAEGETTPRLRFSQFREGDEWQEIPLSEFIGSLDAGVSVNSGDRPALAHEIGVLKTSAVTNGVFEEKENKVVFDEVEIKRVREPVTKDTIIISRMNTPTLVGANAYVKASLANIFLPDRLWAARCKPGVSALFVAIILGSDKGRAALSKLAKGSSGSMKNIGKADVFSLRVRVPSIDEQRCIVECIVPLVDKIEAQTKGVEVLRAHKAALMQRLFPSLEELDTVTS